MANILLAGWGGVGRTTLLSKLSGSKPLTVPTQLYPLSPGLSVCSRRLEESDARVCSRAEESTVVEVKGVLLHFIAPSMSPQSTSAVVANLDAVHGCLLVYDISRSPSANGLFNWWK